MTNMAIYSCIQFSFQYCRASPASGKETTSNSANILLIIMVLHYYLWILQINYIIIFFAQRYKQQGAKLGSQANEIIPRSNNGTCMYHENDGQHPSLNAFYQMVTMFGISVDEYFYPDDYSWALLHIFPLYCKYTLRKELLRNGVNKMFDFFGGVTPMLVSDNCVE